MKSYLFFVLALSLKATRLIAMEPISQTETLNELCRIMAGDNSSALNQMLQETNFDVNHQNEKGTTLLHVAANKNYLACMHLLINLKAYIDAPDNQNTTPLRSACIGNQTEAIKLLLKHGALPYAPVNLFNHYPLAKLFVNGHDAYLFNKLKPHKAKTIELIRFIHSLRPIKKEIKLPLEICKVIASHILQGEKKHLKSLKVNWDHFRKNHPGISNYDYSSNYLG